MFFQNIFWDQKHVTNQIKQESDLSRDSKELFEQCFVKVFDQNRKHTEARNQRRSIPAGFTVSWKDCQKQPPEVFLKILQYPQETPESIFKKSADL